MRKKWWLLLAVVAVFLLLLPVGYLWYSPYLALQNLQRAIIDEDIVTLERYIDFAVLREQLRAQLDEAYLQQLVEANAELESLAWVVAGASIDQQVEDYLTPKGLASIGSTPQPQQGEVATVNNWQVERRGFSEALLHLKGNSKEGMVLNRFGLDWKVTKLQLVPSPPPTEW